MKVTEKLLSAWRVATQRGIPCRQDRGDVQAVLDEILPPPGTNPLSAELAPQRSSLELSLLRRVLLHADGAECDIRNRMLWMTTAPPNMYVPPADPEAEQILTTLVTIRRALMPWAKSDWTSMNTEHDETEQS